MGLESFDLWRQKPDEKRVEACKQKIIVKLRSIIRDGGVFYWRDEQKGGQMRLIPMRIKFGSAMITATDCTGEQRNVGVVNNLVRAITGGFGNPNIVFMIDPPLPQRLIKELQQLDLAYLASRGHTEGLALFNAQYSIRSEPFGEFEPEGFLQKGQNKFKSQKEKFTEFFKYLRAQLDIINKIITEIENSRPDISPEELVGKVLGDEKISRMLSRFQRYQIKRKIYELIPIRRKIDNMMLTEPDPKKLAAYLRSVNPQLLTGNIEVVVRRFSLDFFIHNEQDYLLLYGKEKEAGDSKKDKREDVEDTGGFKSQSQGIPITFTKGFETITPEWRNKVEDHENRHVKNDFLMPEEPHKGLQEAKDEIISYLRDGTNLSEILEVLTQTKDKGGLYTFGMQGNEWREHTKRVERLIRLLMKARCVNLDDLAVLETRHWDLAIQHSFDLKPDPLNENVVFLELGDKLTHEVNFHNILKRISTDPEFTLTQALNKFGDAPDYDTEYYDRVDQLVYAYIMNKKNFKALSINRDIRELCEELSKIEDFIEIGAAYALQDGDSEYGNTLYRELLSKLFAPLISSKSRHLRAVAKQLIAAGSRPVTIVNEKTGIHELVDWYDKINYARKNVACY